MKPMMVYSVLAMIAAQTSTAFAVDTNGPAFGSAIQNNASESLFTKASELSHTLRGHIPAVVKGMDDQGMISGSHVLPVTVALQLNNEDELDAKIEAMYDPSSASYHQFITPQQFIERYAPTAEQIANEKAFLESEGLTVQDVSENQVFIHATGTVAALNSAFKTEMHKYVGKSGKEYFAPAYDLQAPAASRITSVIGMSNTARLHNHLAKPPAKKPIKDPEGSAPGGGLAPNDIRTAYNIPSTLTGAGQSLALFELDGYKAANIAAYEKEFKLAATPLKTILVDGATGTPSDQGGEPEVELDIELMVAIAPKATQILVYEGPNSSAGLIDTYAKIAHDNLAKQISSSWGQSEASAAASDMKSENTIFKQMVAQGQTLFSAAGDNGAEDDGSSVNVDDPSGQPYVVAVGGTKMTIGSKAAWQSEVTWQSDGGGTGGGISKVWSIPSWQAGTIKVDTQSSKKMRNVPDVSLNADPETGYGIYFTDTSSGSSAAQWAPIGGTSAAAPLWAAFNALVNQNRVAKGLTTTGFLNPALYALGVSTKGTTDFHDIADGSNNGNSTGSFKTYKGYDNATGWGSFQATNLLNDLSAK